MSIDILEVPIRHDQAVAISYTWGEFNRTKVPIGHDGNKLISIELGEEWILPEFIDRLASLSSSTPIWLDQLCIPQESKAIRDALASVPTIYRTFDVVVLMPGRPCECLGKFLAESGGPVAPEVDQETLTVPQALPLATRVERYARCLNFIAPSSWVRRLWPRQELMYARRIRCEWASNTTAQCVRQDYGDDQAANLSPYFAALRASILGRDPIPEGEVRLALVRRVAELVAYAGAEVIAYDNSSMTAFYEFLGGRVLEKSSSAPATVHEFMRVFEFLMHGLDSANGTRTATQDRDYVLSVWVDCDGYVIPEDIRDWSMRALLQDATDQMAARHNWNLLTTAPRGLFGSARQHGKSACWHPEQYFESVQVQSLRDVYSSVFAFSPFFHSFPGGIVLFRPVPGDGRPFALSAQAVDYDVFVKDLANNFGEDHQEAAKQSLLSQLNRMVLKWAKLRSSHAIQEHTSTTMSDLCRELLGPWDVQSPEAVQEDLLMMFIMATLHSDTNAPADMQTIPQRESHKHASTILKDKEWGLQQVERPLYKLMAMALGLDAGVCKSKNVRIMVSGKSPDDMRLGFYRGDLDMASLNSRAKMGEVKSVKMNCHPQGRPDIPKGGDLIYEAVKMSGAYSHPRFEVFGVWVPLHDREEGGWNAEALQPMITAREGEQEIGGFLF